MNVLSDIPEKVYKSASNDSPPAVLKIREFNYQFGEWIMQRRVHQDSDIEESTSMEVAQFIAETFPNGVILHAG